MHINLDNFKVPTAIIAHHVAGALIEIFTQEIHLHLASANIGLFAIFQNRIQCMNVFILTRTSIVLIGDDEEIITFTVSISIVQDALSLLLVPPRTSTLLGVALQRLRHGVVNHKPHIFFVDAHSEGYCSNNNLQFILHPLLLDILAFVIAQLCMIVVTLYHIGSFQNFGQFLAFFP